MTEEGKQKNLQILIVDDLGSVRKILRKMLAEIGYQTVEEASDGEEALHKIQNGTFDLVISDWEMPKLKGIDLLKTLRTNDEYKSLPFILVTSLNQKDNVLAALEAGTSDYIAKPFSAGIIRSKIDGLIGKDLKS